MPGGVRDRRRGGGVGDLPRLSRDPGTQQSAFGGGRWGTYESILPRGDGDRWSRYLIVMHYVSVNLPSIVWEGLRIRGLRGRWQDWKGVIARGEFHHVPAVTVHWSNRTALRNPGSDDLWIDPTMTGDYAHCNSCLCWSMCVRNVMCLSPRPAKSRPGSLAEQLVLTRKWLRLTGVLFGLGYSRQHESVRATRAGSTGLMGGRGLMQEEERRIRRWGNGAACTVSGVKVMSGELGASYDYL